MPHGLRDDPHLFVAIAPDGTVTVTCIRSEMGQGVRTSVALVVADELGADWARVKVAQAVGDEPRYGNQNTDGSRSLRQSFAALRRAGAAARTMLEQAAAAAWGVDARQVKATVHEVVDTTSGRKLGFGELAAKAAALSAPDPATVALKAPAEFRYIGKGETALIDGRDIVGGRARTGSTRGSTGCCMRSSRDRRPMETRSRRSMHRRRRSCRVSSRSCNLRQHRCRPVSSRSAAWPSRARRGRRSRRARN